MAAITNREGNTPNASSSGSGRSATSSEGAWNGGPVSFSDQDDHPFEKTTPAKGGSSDTSGPSKTVIANHEGNPNG